MWNEHARRWPLSSAGRQHYGYGVPTLGVHVFALTLDLQPLEQEMQILKTNMQKDKSSLQP